MPVSNIQCSITAAHRNKFDSYQRKLIRWFAQRPLLTLSFIITFGVGALPVITIMILTPIAFLLNCMEIFTSGGVIAMYSILLKSSALAFFLLLLLIAGFLAITFTGLIHSYGLLFNSLRQKQA